MLLDTQIKLRRHVRGLFPKCLEVEEPKYRGYLEEFPCLYDLIPLRYRLFSVKVRKIDDTFCSEYNNYDHVYFLDSAGNVLYRSRWYASGYFSMLTALRRAVPRSQLGDVRQVIGMSWWYCKIFPYCKFEIYKIPRQVQGDRYLAGLLNAYDEVKRAERERKEAARIAEIATGRREAQAAKEKDD